MTDFEEGMEEVYADLKRRSEEREETQEDHSCVECFSDCDCGGNPFDCDMCTECNLEYGPEVDFK